MPRLSRSRLAAALALGAVAGAGLGLAALPLGLQWAGYGHLPALAYYLRPLVWLPVVVMAFGGVGVARARHAVEAVKAFSLAGLVAGAGQGVLGLELAPPLLAAAGLTGWIYGLLAGLVAVPLLVPRAIPEVPVAAPPTLPEREASDGLDGDAI